MSCELSVVSISKHKVDRPLDGCQQVTSAGVKSVAHLSTLELLNLCNTSVDDAAVDSLVKLNNLRRLNIIGTKVSDQGVARLRHVLPDCDIRR